MEPEEIKILLKRTINGADFYLLKVKYGKKQRWTATWCETEKDIESVFKERHAALVKKAYEKWLKRSPVFRSRWREEDFDTVEHYFPGATTEPRATKRFKTLCETAPLMTFEPISKKQLCPLN